MPDICESDVHEEDGPEIHVYVKGGIPPETEDVKVRLCPVVMDCCVDGDIETDMGVSLAYTPTTGSAVTLNWNVHAVVFHLQEVQRYSIIFQIKSEHIHSKRTL